MAKLGGWMDWLGAGRQGGRREGADYRLRALPREEILLYVKEIDNRQAERRSNPKETMASTGIAAGVVAFSLLAILMLLPGTYSVLVSHQMETLKQDRAELVNTLREVRAERARMESPEQVETWAQKEFVVPAANAVLYTGPSLEKVAKLNPEGR